MNDAPLLPELAAQVSSMEDLANFISELADYAREPPPEEGVNIYTYIFLEAMSSWMKSAIRHPDSIGGQYLGEEISWKTFARILVGGLAYD